MSTEPTCPADGNLLADDGVCGFCGNAPEAFDTTKPDEKLVELADMTRKILDLHRKRSGVQAEMIRACLEQLTRAPDHGVMQYTSWQERRKRQQKNRDDRAAAFAGLEALAGMLEKDAAGQGDA